MYGYRSFTESVEVSVIVIVVTAERAVAVIAEGVIAVVTGAVWFVDLSDELQSHAFCHQIPIF